MIWYLKVISMIAVVLVSLTDLAHAGIWYLPLPEDISLNGWRIDRVIKYLDLVITIAFGLVLAALIYFIFRYRARAGHTAVYDRGDKPVNILITACLGLLVFFSIDAVIEKMSFHDLKEVFWNFPKGKDVLKVEIMPQQFAWNIRYAGDDGEFATADDIVAPLNHLRVPLDTAVVVQMTPYDVVHSFYIANLRIKQDAVPGTITTFWFQATKQGVYEIACSALCGMGHTNMRGFLTVESKEGFEQWLNSLRAKPLSAEEDFWTSESTPGGMLTNWGWKWQATPSTTLRVDAEQSRSTKLQ